MGIADAPKHFETDQCNDCDAYASKHRFTLIKSAWGWDRYPPCEKPYSKLDVVDCKALVAGVRGISISEMMRLRSSNDMHTRTCGYYLG